LILEKKKTDKNKLAQSITQNIVWIVELNPQSTISIIQNYIQEIQDNLIEALSKKE
jgi:phenylpyruvate tautomerase PptA (4-oxalocrotonate tautomerase family)